LGNLPGTAIDELRVLSRFTWQECVGYLSIRSYNKKRKVVDAIKTKWMDRGVDFDDPESLPDLESYEPTKFDVGMANNLQLLWVAMCEAGIFMESIDDDGAISYSLCDWDTTLVSWEAKDMSLFKAESLTPRTLHMSLEVDGTQN